MKWTTLEDVSTLVSKGTTPTTLGYSFVPDGVPFLRAEDVVGAAINPGAVAFCISEETDKLLSRSRLQPGDLLVTIAGTLGRIGYVPLNAPPLNCNQAVAFVRLKPQLIDLLYACFACQARIVDLLALRKIGTIGNLNLEQVRQFKIPLPPICEQKCIATLLNRTDHLCRARGFALELTDNLLPAAFVELFGDPEQNPNEWPQQPLSAVCSKFSDGPFGSNLKSSDYRSSGVRVVRLQNIGVGEFLDYDKAFVSKEHFAALQKHTCIPGDVLIGTMGDPNLRACIQPMNIPIALNKADCIQARPDRKYLNATYLQGLLNIPSTLHLVPGMVHGQTRARVSMGELARLPIPVPPLPLQQKFAALAERVERLRAVQREGLRQAEHLFGSLLHRAFNADGEPISTTHIEIPAGGHSEAY